jgi:hypothetical protein
MWSENQETHNECANKILAVAAEKDQLARYELALREIAAGTAALGIERIAEWAGVMAMYALHPSIVEELSSPQVSATASAHALNVE